MIKVKNLNKYFYRHKSNQIHVINDVTLEFPKTGLVTIVGSSGSGKTTLMNVLGGLDDFESGSIQIDDLEINKYSSKKIDRVRNEKIGYIFQNYLLLQQRTVYENLELLLNMYDLSKKEKEERIEYVLKAVGMLKYKKKNVSELSGGQQQRVAIARTLIKSPSLILADEPTGNLDEKNTIQIMNIIKKISKTTLVILVSHEERIAASYSDYIIEFSDGKVINNSDKASIKTYQYEDDQNIYLKEYNDTNLNNDVINIDYYDNDCKKIDLKIIHKNGKVYIYSDEEITLINKDSEIKIVDDYKQELNIEKEIEESSYDLPVLSFVKTPSLPFKEQINLAFQNLANLKKRILFLLFPLFVISVLVLISIQSVVSASYVDRKSLVQADSRIYTVSFEKAVAETSDTKLAKAFTIFYDKLKTDYPSLLPILNTHPVITFQVPKFNQLLSDKTTLKGFSILPWEMINEDDLIYGRMPENDDEVVIDKWVIENTINDTVTANYMTVGSFIGKEISMRDKAYPYKIVGIVESENNTLYFDKWEIFNIYPSDFKNRNVSYKLCSQSKFEKETGSSLNIDLKENEIIINKRDNNKIFEGEYVTLISGDENSKCRIVDEFIFGSVPYECIVSDSMYEKIYLGIAKKNLDKFEFIVKDEEEMHNIQNYLDNLISDYQENGIMLENGEKVEVQIFHKSSYYSKLQPYLDEAQKNVTQRTLITVTITIIAVVLIFFSMKSFSIKNIYDIGVYRALGINKRSIVFVYAIETFIISLRTIFIGTTLCFLITNFIASIPIIDATFKVSFPIYLFTTLLLMLINVIVGIIPIVLYLRLTPSKILTKYDV